MGDALADSQRMCDGYSMDAKWDTEVGYGVDTDTVREGIER